MRELNNIKRGNRVETWFWARDNQNPVSTGFAVLILCALTFFGCAYRLVIGPLMPLPQAKQAPEIGILDDGTVLYARERFEVGLRPVTDEELNRKFPEQSKGGAFSTNPYTFGDWRPIGQEKTPTRFTIFLLSVKNYVYPKVRVDPLTMTIISKNGRQYSPLSFEMLKEYYIKYVVGYGGNPYERFELQKDLLKKTLYPDDPEEQIIFSGQTQDGYVVFPRLDDDVREITVRVDDIVLRFDSWNRPVETLDLAFQFKREVKHE